MNTNKLKHIKPTIHIFLLKYDILGADLNKYITKSNPVTIVVVINIANKKFIIALKLKILVT